jgi:hypothetical protein
MHSPSSTDSTSSNNANARTCEKANQYFYLSRAARRLVVEEGGRTERGLWGLVSFLLSLSYPDSLVVFLFPLLLFLTSLPLFFPFVSPSCSAYGYILTILMPSFRSTKPNICIFMIQQVGGATRLGLRYGRRLDWHMLWGCVSTLSLSFLCAAIHSYTNRCLDLNPARFSLDEQTSERRKRLYWQLVYMDVCQVCLLFHSFPCSDIKN